MKYLAFIFAIATTSLFTCDQPNPNLTDTSPFVKNTELLAEVDTIISQTNRQFGPGVNPTTTTMLFNGEQHSMTYFDLDDGLTRLDGKFTPDGFEHYATFYMKDGQLAWFRYREWDMTKHFASEIFAYVKDGKIFYATERSVQLPPNQSPAYLREIPHIESQQTRKAVFEIMDTYYAPMKKGWDEREATQE